LQSALEINRTVYGEKHVSTAMVYGAIGSFYEEYKKEPLRAIEYYTCALISLSNEDFMTKRIKAFVCYSIGMVYAGLVKDDADIETSIQWLRRSAETDKEIVHEFLNDILRQAALQILNAKTEDETNSGIELMYTCAKMTKAIFGEESEEVSSINTLLNISIRGFGQT